MASTKSPVEDWADEFILPEDREKFFSRITPGSSSRQWAQVAYGMGYGQVGSGKPFFAMMGFEPPYELTCSTAAELLEQCADLRLSIEKLSSDDYEKQNWYWPDLVLDLWREMAHVAPGEIRPEIPLRADLADRESAIRYVDRAMKWCKAHETSRKSNLDSNNNGPTGEADDDVLHSMDEPRPPEYKYGPFSGTRGKTTYCLTEKTHTRNLLKAVRSLKDHVWVQEEHKRLLHIWTKEPGTTITKRAEEYDNRENAKTK